MDKCGIYQIWCNQNGKFYIGSSKRIYVRWREHRHYLRKGISNCPYLQHAWTKHGEAAFRFSVLEECSVDELEIREQFYIDTLKPHYNSITDVKRRYSAEARAKIAAAIRARAALITHCPNGHLYDEKNSYIDKNGSKICRACNAERVSKIYASETPEQREARRVKVNKYQREHRDARLAKQAEYVRTHKAEKAAYDRKHRAEFTAKQRERRRHETPEQHQRRLRMKRESYYRCKADVETQAQEDLGPQSRGRQASRNLSGNGQKA